MSIKPVQTLGDCLEQALKLARKNRYLAADLKAVEVHQRVEQSYGNPLNWRTTGFVELIHRGRLGELSNLGLFEEQYYRNTDARRLRRTAGTLDPQPSVRTEFVSGDYWLSPRVSPFHQYEQTPLELLTLQARFEELMEDFSAELECLPSGTTA